MQQKSCSFMGPRRDETQERLRGGYQVGIVRTEVVGIEGPTPIIHNLLRKRNSAGLATFRESIRC